MITLQSVERHNSNSSYTIAYQSINYDYNNDHQNIRKDIQPCYLYSSGFILQPNEHGGTNLTWLLTLDKESILIMASEILGEQNYLIQSLLSLYDIIMSS